MESERRRKHLRDLQLLGFVLVAAAIRLMPHPPNFLPTMALTIFAGAQFPSLLFGGIVVLASLLLSDIVLGFHSTMPFVYLSLLVILLASRRLQGRFFDEGKNALLLLGFTVGSSLFFFLVTNLGVFIMQDLYPKTIAGLIACYVAALPFFQTSLGADLLYVSLIFGCWHILCEEQVVRPEDDAPTKRSRSGDSHQRFPA